MVSPTLKLLSANINIPDMKLAIISLAANPTATPTIPKLTAIAVISIPSSLRIKLAANNVNAVVYNILKNLDNC